jgi:hypothetical protein
MRGLFVWDPPGDGAEERHLVSRGPAVGGSRPDGLTLLHSQVLATAG